MDNTTFQFFSDQANHWDYSTIVGSFGGALLSGLVAIIIFVWGIHNEKRKTRKASLRRLKEQENYLRVQLSVLSDEAFKQALQTINFLREIRLEKEQDQTLKSVSGFNPGEINSINDQDQFSLLVHYRAGDRKKILALYQEFRSSVNYLVDVKRTFEKVFNDYSRKSEMYETGYKDSLEKIVRTFEEFGTISRRAGLKRGEDTFLDSYMVILENFLKQRSFKDIYISYNYLIIPLNELCKNLLKKMPDMRITFISTEVMNAIANMDNYNNTKRVYIEYFTSLARGINSTAQKANNSFNFLCKNKLAVH